MVRWIKQLGLISTAADIDNVAAADSGGVLAVPALAGPRPPWRRLEANASFPGTTSSTTAGHIVVAILQGLAAQVAGLGVCVAADLGRPLTRLRVDGGLTRCRMLMQSVADLLQVELQVSPSTHAAAFGAAALGRSAVDPRLGLADAIVAWEPRETYTPNWSTDQAADFLDRWTIAARHT